MTGAISIQGGRGSFHEAAAQLYFGEDSEFTFAETFADVYTDVLSGKVGRGVVALANNRYGFVGESYDLLRSHAGSLWICGEIYLRIEHQLLGIEGVTLNQIKEVHSQAPALGQCHSFLHDKLSMATRIEQDDTARSAELIAKLGDPTKAAIASRKAGELYGLKVLAGNIQDDADNLTRFLVIEAKNGHTPTAEDTKSTIILRTSNEPGSLLEALGAFKRAGINLSSLHSSFLPNTAFEMEFFVELEAGLGDPATKNALEEIEEYSDYVTLLGSYAGALIPIGARND